MGIFESTLLMLMRETGTSNSALGRAVNATPSTVQNWLSGKTSPKITTALEICAYFNVTISEMVGDEELTEERIAEIRQYHVANYGNTKRVEYQAIDWGE